jgi:hypothetical protein
MQVRHPAGQAARLCQKPRGRRDLVRGRGGVRRMSRVALSIDDHRPADGGNR